MTTERARHGLVASPSFVFRTPRLPLDDLLRWSSGLIAAGVPAADATTLAEALRHDRTLLRRRLREVFTRPELRDALFVASPGLEASLDAWLEDPTHAGGEKTERALVRYFTRMTSRATPFGLFSGVSAGRTGDRTQLALAPQADYVRHTRLDNEYLFALAEGLAREPSLRSVLRFATNSSAYAAAGRVHYAQSSTQGTTRAYRLVAVEHTDYLEATLRRARDGATRGELARALVADDPEIELAEAEAFIDELIDTEMLVPRLGPTVTGPAPLDALIERLRELPEPHAALVATALDEAGRRIAVIDADARPPTRRTYEEVTAALVDLPTPTDVATLFQVDLVKPTIEATLGPAVLDEIARGVSILARLSPHASPLQAFRDAFVARYEEREVPLVEALDDEIGIGFAGAHAGDGEASPLLTGLSFPSARRGATMPWGKRERFLLRRLEAVWRSGARELTLDEADLGRLALDDHARIPDAFSTSTQLAAASPEALARGEFRLLFESGGGPSGARLSGRFCHVSEDIHAGVRDHLRAEEALQPEAVFAEVAYLPEGRLGNVACRPVLRDFEIVYMGRSGAPLDRQIPLSDLLVSVRGGRVVLRSRRLDREVVPRCSTAHNYATHGFGAYRFLCTLQAQDGDYFGFDWGPFADAPFLPRVSHRKLVLATARWRLEREDLEPLARAARGGGAEGSAADRSFVAVQAMRQRLDLPRHLLVVDGDRELHVDLDNALCVDSFVHLVRGRTVCYLKELFPGPDELCVRGPEGAFRAELSVSFVQVRPPSPARAAAPTLASSRRFAPGSSWLYAKLYAGPATTDELLRRCVGPLARRVLAEGLAEDWFFVRYRDPEWHLRVRMRGHSSHGPGVDALAAAVWQGALEEGLAWRVQLDTYEREVERYGGPQGIELAERIARHDSDAALDLIDCIETEQGLDARWRLALLGTDMLLGDLGLDLPTKYEVIVRARDAMATELGVDDAFGRQLAAKFRPLRADLATLLDGADSTHALAPGIEILRARSRALTPVVHELHAHARAGRLSRTLPELAWTFVHMHINRLLRSAHRAQELVIYDLLRRLYASALARGRKPRSVGDRGTR